MYIEIKKDVALFRSSLSNSDKSSGVSPWCLVYAIKQLTGTTFSPLQVSRRSRFLVPE